MARFFVTSACVARAAIQAPIFIRAQIKTLSWCSPPSTLQAFSFRDNIYSRLDLEHIVGLFLPPCRVHVLVGTI